MHALLHGGAERARLRVEELVAEQEAVGVDADDAALDVHDVGYAVFVPVHLFADIKIGDHLVSSGLGGYFPTGYPVGTVKAITQQKGDEFTTITVTPSARLNQHQVLLIWPGK